MFDIRLRCTYEMLCDALYPRFYLIFLTMKSRFAVYHYFSVKILN